MSYKPQVKVNGEWNGNGLRFATKDEAERSAANLFSRWMLCTGHRAVESDEPVKNALNTEGKLQFIEPVDEAQGGEQVSTYIVPHDVPEGTVIVAEEDKEKTA
jgi:hypothetical protein